VRPTSIKRHLLYGRGNDLSLITKPLGICKVFLMGDTEPLKERRHVDSGVHYMAIGPLAPLVVEFLEDGLLRPPVSVSLPLASPAQHPIPSIARRSRAPWPHHLVEIRVAMPFKFLERFEENGPLIGHSLTPELGELRRYPLVQRRFGNHGVDRKRLARPSEIDEVTEKTVLEMLKVLGAERFRHSHRHHERTTSTGYRTPQT
jgi:hypothetical protein